MVEQGETEEAAPEKKSVIQTINAIHRIDPSKEDIK